MVDERGVTSTNLGEYLDKCKDLACRFLNCRNLGYPFSDAMPHVGTGSLIHRGRPKLRAATRAAPTWPNQ
ncbi:MAG TPA: hypothetical protein DCF44_00550 [Chitinophagaceae bacterium]|nr:hypothetical protein [Chitinophagaceae bacterium]